MKSIKNILKNKKLTQLFLLFTIIFATNTFSMRMPEKGKTIAKSSVMKMQQQKQLPQEKKDQYFIHEQGTNEGIWVDKELVKENCKSIKNMIEDLGGQDLTEISLDCPIEIITLAFDILNTKNILHIKIDISDLSLAQLVAVANLFNYLDVPSKILEAVVHNIKIYMEQNSDTIVSNKELKQLNPDLQKLLMTNPTISYLKNFIIKTYANNRKKVLAGHPYVVSSVAFSPDGTKIVSGSNDPENNLILWDISNPNNITPQHLIGHPNSVTTVAFSPDGTKIISGCTDRQNNLILWDISNPHTITPQPLLGHPDSVTTAAFSPDGTKIISGCMGRQNNLILWDVATSKQIKELEGHPNDVNTVAFSPDGIKIISGCFGKQDILIVWDISDLHTIIDQKLEGHPATVWSASFSPDGKQIISGSGGKKNNLLLRNVNNPEDYQPLPGHPEYVSSAAFSPDGKKIVSSSWTSQNNLILWDINNLSIAQPLIKHQNIINVVAYSPNNINIVSGGSGGKDNLILWDVTDPQNITHHALAGHPDNVNTAAFSPDGMQIISGCYGANNNLILWTLLTDQEKQLLDQLKNYHTDQLQLIYQLCLQALNGQKIELKKNSDEQKIFMTLPQETQKLLTDLFLKKSWFAGWWS